VPGLRVVDVPMTQAERNTGESKATARQGLLYVRHLRSLFFDVPGSARAWKFGLVGLSGLCVFLPILAIMTGVVGLLPLVAFVPAFGLSAAWNTAMNWRLTFGDQRRGGRGPRHYLEFALLSGCVMFGVFAVLVEARVATVLAGLAAALVAMLINGLVNRAFIHRGPAVWAAIAIDQGVQGGLARLAADVGADRAYVLPARGDASSGLPAGLLAHVIAYRRPVLITEAASYRAQRRTNIETASRSWSASDSPREASSRPLWRRQRWRSRPSSLRSSPPRRTSRSAPRWLRPGQRPEPRGSPTATGGFVPARVSTGPGTSAALRAALLTAGIGAAVALRVVLGGSEGAGSMPAGLAFALVLLALAVGAGWRPGRPSLPAAALGGGGGVVLVAAWLSAPPGTAVDLAPLNAAIALWTPIVAIIAVAEEVALRGVLFDAVRERGGDGLALLATSALFALMHLPLYGIGALPLDLAVGLMLGGLRIVSGGVLAPAVAHVIADLAGGWLL
jgi:membrane protease YdiL (CAAX protease family)